MRKVLATLIALSLLVSMFTGVFAPVPEARAAGPAPVVLGTAGNFVILAKTGISTTGTTHVTGDIGVSPGKAGSISGFALVDPPTTFTTSALVTGNVYAADYDPPTPDYMTTAIGDMQTAYTNAAGRAAGVGPNLNLGAGTVADQTLVPGTYTWGTSVTITTDLSLSGGADDVWIFQIAGTLDIATGKQVLLSGGAQAKNIFWQVSGAVTLNAGSHFEGNILAQTNIAMLTGATLNGRALAQTAVTLDANIVLAPTSSAIGSDKAITAFNFAALSPAVIGGINVTAHTIALTVPFGTVVTALVPTITITGASVSPASLVAHNFTNSVVYTVTAGDASTQPYIVTVTVAAATSDKAITAFKFAALSPAVIGVVNETAKTVALTVPFGTVVTALVPTITFTGASVSPASLMAQNFTNQVVYTVTASDTSIQPYVVTVTVAGSTTAKAIMAFKFAALSPAVIGVVNETAKTVALTVPFGTNVTALVPTITILGASVSPASLVAQNFTNSVVYTVTAGDASIQPYVVTVTVAASTTAKAITAFKFAALSPAVIGTITGTAIALTVPNGTDVTALVPTFTTTGVSVYVGSTAQVSGTTPNNFTNSVVYTVTAGDASTQPYIVTVTVAAATSAKAITAFNFNGLTPAVIGTITGTAIALAVPNGTDVTALVPTFTTTGVSVYVGSTAQVSGITPNDFTNPVVYLVTASDASTQPYIVTVNGVPTAIRGDINGDGIVTMADALLVARYVVGLTTLTASQLLAADLNHDGFVNMVDVLVIAQIVVGISS